MNRGGFSWKRFVGISALKSKISRYIGIPLTRSGRQRKIGALIEKFIFSLFGFTSRTKRSKSNQK
ncbi:hypothetical protein ELY16_11030 [Legionella qingyii]|nr:hypothetical protein ELY16_11030 [Legionella qingyii]